jgi:CHAT domain-containing protein/Tfp pilus assembly protein PilF
MENEHWDGFVSRSPHFNPNGSSYLEGSIQIGMAKSFLSLLVILLPALTLAQEASWESRVSLMKQAMDLRKEGKYHRAIELIDSLQTLSAGQKDSLMAYSWHQKGVNHQLLGDWPSAAAAYQEAVSLRRNLPNGQLELSLSLHNLGRISISQYLFRRATRYFLEAIALRDELGERYRSAQSQYYLAEIYQELGDYPLAEGYCIQALAVFREQERGSWIARTELFLGNILHKSERLAEAIEAYQSALAINDSLGRTRAVALCYHSLANIYDQLNELDQAILASREAERIYLALDDSYSLGRLYNNLGVTYKKKGEPTKAENYYQQSLQLRSYDPQNPRNPDWGDALDNLGDLQFERSHHEEAARYYLKAIQTCLPDFEPLPGEFATPVIGESTLVLGLKAHLLIYLHSLAKTYEKMASTKALQDPIHRKALHCYRAADALVYKMREEQPSEKGRQQWLNQTRDLYQDAIRLAFQLQETEEAFYFMEKSKATLLLASLKDAQAKSFAGIPDSLLAREAELQEVFRSLENQWMLADSNQREKLKTQLAERQTLWQEFIARLELDYPAYYELKYQSVPLFSGELQEWLASQERKKVILSYFWGREESWYLQIEADTIHFRRFDSFPDSLIQEYQGLLHKPWQLKREQARWQELGDHIREQIVPPETRAGAGLVIFPDGLLNRIPFGSLPQKGQDKADNPSFLLAQFPIQYAYSATTLLRHPLDLEEAPKNILAVAPVSFSALPSLNKSVEEVKGLAQYPNSRVLLHQEASLSSLMTHLKDYRIIHLSTHASAGNPQNQYPWIALSDTQLYLPQIYASPLRADLVVLSACESSDGPYQIGEGPMSLARGFQYAGAPSTVASLWQVNEASTTLLMRYFYQYLEEGFEKDEALQKAKLDFLESVPPVQKSPYYWAAFVQFGQNDALAFRPAVSWWLGLAGFLVMLALFVGIYRVLRKKS